MCLRAFLVSFLISGSYQQLESSLELVSDLTTQDCYDQNLDFKLNGKGGLPQCVKFTSVKTGCNLYHTKAYREYVTYLPSCTKEATFAAKQCKGERTTGRCFCYNKSGYRIFGQEWWSKADNMTCACSRRKAEMEEDEDPLYFNSLHCNSMGNYEPLQCDLVSEQCWCAEEQTGALISPVVPIKAVAMLPCYEVLKVGSQYTRQCDSKKFGMKKIENKLALHGTTSYFDTFVCDEDGAYGSYTMRESQVICTWRDNTKLGSWASAPPISTSLNCYCARDSRIYADSGKGFKLYCNQNGNYNFAQGSTGAMYCVDPDGIRKSDVDPKVQQETDCDQFISYAERHDNSQ